MQSTVLNGQGQESIYRTTKGQLILINFKMSFWCHRLDQNTNEKIDNFLP